MEGAYVSAARPLEAVIVGFLLLAPYHGLAQVSVDSCGQSLTGDGVLTGDLDCTGMATALSMREARLGLAGFSITGAPIACETNCAIEGPGTIAGVVQSNERRASLAIRLATVTGPIGAVAPASTLSQKGMRIAIEESTVLAPVTGYSIDMSGSTVNGSATYGLNAGKVNVIDSFVTDNADEGIRCRSASIAGSTISGNGEAGILCAFWHSTGEFGGNRVGKVEVFDSTVSNNGVGGSSNPPGGLVVAKKARLERTLVTDNAPFGIYMQGERHSGPDGAYVKFYGKALLSESTVSGSLVGVVTYAQASLRGSTVTGCQRGGIQVEGKIRLDDSSVTGNAVDPNCGVTLDCVDLVSTSKPVLVNGATCETSREGIPMYYQSTTWDVCTLD